MQIPVVINPLPWKRALHLADNGLAGIAGIYKTLDRQKKFDYSDALFQEELVLFIHKDNKAIFRSLIDFRKKKIGVIRGWRYGNEFDTYRENSFFYVEEVKNDEQNFSMLLYKRIDCAIAIKESGRMQLSKKRFHEAIIQLPSCVTTNATYLIFPKVANQTVLLSRFNDTLNGMKQKGEYKEIIDKSLSKVIE